MEKKSNSGWYILSAAAMLCLLAYRIGKPAAASMQPAPVTDSNAAPDTAADTEIIITPGK